MGLVDGDQADFQRRKKPLEGGEGQAFGSNVDYLDLALPRSAPGLREISLAGRVLFSIAAGTPLALRPSTWSFIRAMRGETTRVMPLETQRRQLVAKRLAAAGGHQHQGVAAGEHLGDDLFLQGQEPVETEIGFE